MSSSKRKRPLKPLRFRSGGVTYMGVDDLSKAFAFIARDCLTGARILHGRSPSFGPLDTPDKVSQRVASKGEYILTTHALELGLKAFLAKTGIDEAVLRNNYHHDLERLYKEAVDRGFKPPGSYSSDIEGLVAWINEYHNVPLRYGYGEKNIELPPCDALFPIIDALLALIPG